MSVEVYDAPTPESGEPPLKNRRALTTPGLPWFVRTSPCFCGNSSIILEIDKPDSLSAVPRPGFDQGDRAGPGVGECTRPPEGVSPALWSLLKSFSKARWVWLTQPRMRFSG